MSAQTEFDFNAPPKAETTAQPATKAILDRIKKLLRLGADQRGNSREAEVAMALAYELAEKHRVDVGSLDLDEETRRLLDERWPMGMRFDAVRQRVFGILQTFFHVTLCLLKPEVIVVGKPVDLAIARYVHDFLLRASRDCLRRYEAEERGLYRRRMTPRKRAGFVAGFFYGISHNLRRAHSTLELNDAQNAIVLREDAERAARLAELVPNQATVKLRKSKMNESAVACGFYAGLDTSIHTPLGGGSPEAPLALPA